MFAFLFFLEKKCHFFSKSSLFAVIFLHFEMTCDFQFWFFCFPVANEFQSRCRITIQLSSITPTNYMSELQFNWNWPKIEFGVDNIVDQTRFNCAFSGQDPDQANERDLRYYNSDQLFLKMEITKRHLHGKDGFYVRVNGVAEALRSQLVQNGRDAALLIMTPESLGVPAATMIRDGWLLLGDPSDRRV